METATIEHHVTDQGNGGAVCGNCREFLGSNALAIPQYCPKCKRRLIEIGSIYINMGGSDF